MISGLPACLLHDVVCSLVCCMIGGLLACLLYSWWFTRLPAVWLGDCWLESLVTCAPLGCGSLACREPTARLVLYRCCLPSFKDRMWWFGSSAVLRRVGLNWMLVRIGCWFGAVAVRFEWVGRNRTNSNRPQARPSCHQKPEQFLHRGHAQHLENGLAGSHQPNIHCARRLQVDPQIFAWRLRLG
jgi:hypothetical protein